MVYKCYTKWLLKFQRSFYCEKRIFRKRMIFYSGLSQLFCAALKINRSIKPLVIAALKRDKSVLLLGPR